MATDSFANLSSTHSSPGVNAEAVTPDDSTDLTNVTRGLYVGTGGDLVVIMQGGQTITFTAVPTGAVLPIRVSRVKSTSTTASDIVALW